MTPQRRFLLRPEIDDTLEEVMERYLVDHGWVLRGLDTWVKPPYRLAFFDAVNRQMAEER